MVLGGFKMIANVGVIGLGNMGSAIARRLLDQGHTVTVWNHTKSRCEPLADLGVNVAATPETVAGTVDVLITNLIDHKAIMMVLNTEALAPHCKHTHVYSKCQSPQPR